MPRLSTFMLAVGIVALGSSQAAPKGAPCVARSAPNEPRPASSVEVHLPAIPKLEEKPLKVGDAYSVWGASYYLRSRAHRKDVADKTIVIEGYIVKTNLAEAPRCAVHRGGIADAWNCRAPVPAFWIGDTPNAAPSTSIKVMGWASNFAQIYDAIRAFDAGKPEFTDVLWGVRLPDPLPVAGAKVRVTGVYGTAFVMASSGAERDERMGLLTIREMSILEPAPELATLPGVRRAPAPKK